MESAVRAARFKGGGRDASPYAGRLVGFRRALATPGKNEGRPCGRPPKTTSRVPYLACLKMYFVISNIVTEALPPNSAFSLSSALIWRRFFLS